MAKSRMASQFDAKLEKQIALAKKYPDMMVCYTASAFIDDDGRQFDYVILKIN